MKAYRVSGRFKMGQQELTFSKEFALSDRNLAEEKTFTELGSKHRCKRRDIKIEKIDEILADQIIDPVIRQMITGK